MVSRSGGLATEKWVEAGFVTPRPSCTSIAPVQARFEAILSRPAYRPTERPPIFPITRGRLASTGLMKESQRAQVQSPGKTVWNDSTANTELALAA